MVIKKRVFTTLHILWQKLIYVRYGMTVIHTISQEMHVQQDAVGYFYISSFIVEKHTFKSQDISNLGKMRPFVQGVFFNWCSPKINKYGKKFKYQYWCPPKIYKYGEKLKYQNWCTPNHYQFWGNCHGDLHIWRWEHAAGFRQRLLVQGYRVSAQLNIL